MFNKRHKKKIIEQNLANIEEYAFNEIEEYKNVCLDDRIIGVFDKKKINIDSENKYKIFYYLNDKELCKKYFAISVRISDNKPAAILIDGEILCSVYEAVDFKTMDDVRKIFSIHDLNFDEISDSLRYFSKEDVARWNDLKRDFLEKYNLKKDLTNISDGYNMLYKDELNNIRFEAEELLYNLGYRLKSKIDERFFNYSSSVIKDLSSINGVQIFEWEMIYKQAIFENYVVEKFGGKFWAETKTK